MSKRLTLEQVPGALSALGFVRGADGEYHKQPPEDRAKPVGAVAAPKRLSPLRWRRLSAWLALWVALWAVGLWVSWSPWAAGVYLAVIGVGAFIAVKPRKEL